MIGDFQALSNSFRLPDILKINVSDIQIPKIKPGDLASAPCTIPMQGAFLLQNIHAFGTWAMDSRQWHQTGRRSLIDINLRYSNLQLGAACSAHEYRGCLGAPAGKLKWLLPFYNLSLNTHDNLIRGILPQRQDQGWSNNCSPKLSGYPWAILRDLRFELPLASRASLGNCLAISILGVPGQRDCNHNPCRMPGYSIWGYFSGT